MNNEKSAESGPGKSVELSETFTEGVWVEYFPKLARLASRKLGATPRRDFNEEDIALSAIQSFFTGVEQGRFEITERDSLWQLLATITARKVIKQNRRFFADKRGGGKVRGESVFHTKQSDVNADRGLEQFIDPNATPEFSEHFLATCEDLLGILKDEKLRQTALMRMEGYSNQETSTRLGCSVARTKQRLSKIRSLWDAHN